MTDHVIAAVALVPHDHAEDGQSPHLQQRVWHAPGRGENDDVFVTADPYRGSVHLSAVLKTPELDPDQAEHLAASLLSAAADVRERHAEIHRKDTA